MIFHAVFETQKFQTAKEKHTKKKQSVFFVQNCGTFQDHSESRIEYFPRIQKCQKCRWNNAFSENVNEKSQGGLKDLVELFLRNEFKEGWPEEILPSIDAGEETFISSHGAILKAQVQRPYGWEKLSLLFFVEELKNISNWIHFPKLKQVKHTKNIPNTLKKNTS